jgi:hypothetical protein
VSVLKPNQYLNPGESSIRGDENVPSTIVLLGHVLGRVVDNEVRGFLGIPSCCSVSDGVLEGDKMERNVPIDIPSHCYCSVLDN